MAQLIKVNPTRMELSKLKKRLKTAQRGHKLLKDKRDELVKQFLELVRKNRELRTEVEMKLKLSHEAFAGVSAVMSPQSLEEALIYPKQSVVLEPSEKNIMSVDVPVFEYKMQGNQSDIFSYGFAFTSGELDDAVQGLSDVLSQLVELAETEKSVMLLASEIEKTRRRVNALEHVLIPNLQYTIKNIMMKLDENERGNTTRLMKVKDMVLKQNSGY
ncbi:MAG: V-type ATP synthase subunit D [Ruminococcaceae bacterium]|nr:V-type ATP synthase subunit D [Oscillospiraceae bacterium]MBQ2915803.1 V-type ATP synthase subunit D [Clostridia bacterium]